MAIICLAVHERYPEKEYVWQVSGDFVKQYGVPQPGDIALAICGYRKGQHREPVLIKSVIQNISFEEAKRIAGRKFINFLDCLLIQNEERIPDYEKWQIEGGKERYWQLQEIWRDKVKAEAEAALKQQEKKERRKKNTTKGATHVGMSGLREENENRFSTEIQ